jgi:uncharacterized protein (TIGR03790 family)
VEVIVPLDSRVVLSVCALFVSLWALSCGVDSAAAGGGPENVFVVVNPRSWSSRTIANHFCRLRRIPASHVLLLDWKGGNTRTNVEGFRNLILSPVIDEIDKRRLGGQIDYIVYSSDFPYEIQFDTDLPNSARFSSGSITGLTYLSQLVQAKDSNYTRSVNWYMRMPSANANGARSIDGEIELPTHGFRSSYQWGPDGNRVERGGLQYILCTMLAYTSGRGNSVPEGIDYLQRSALADGTHPRGTVYFMMTRDSGSPQQYDVRSAARQPAFAPTVDALKALGVRAQIVEGPSLPQNRRDVVGVMAGTPVLDWESSGSTLLPGAICENFTSFGGALHGENHQTRQTRLSEFLRYGAAGSSGTVVEPYALWPKFPHPMLHAHYARGCTLSEAFYQSVPQPYQLLIVGDPLCRPWATIPIVTVDGLPAGGRVSGRLALGPQAQTPPGTDVAHFELFLDGQRVAQARPQQHFDLDTEQLADGYHELRIVAVESSPIESQGRMIVPITVDNRGGRLAWATRPARAAPWEQPIRVRARSAGAKEIVILHGRRMVGRISGENGETQIDPRDLGYGPVTLHAVALRGEAPDQHVLGRPISLEISPPRPLPAVARTAGLAKWDPIRIRLASGQYVAVGEASDKDWLVQSGVELGQPFEISGHLSVPQEAVYQFEMEFVGRCEVLVDDDRVFRNDSDVNQHYYIPVGLAEGIHRIRIRGALRKTPKFFLAFGSRGTSPITDARFRPR